MYYFCNQEEKDYENGSSLPHIPLIVQPTAFHHITLLKLFWQRLPMIPAKANSISLVLILTHETTQLASKIALSKLQWTVSDCSFLVLVVARIMAPQRCPPPHLHNL